MSGRSVICRLISTLTASDWARAYDWPRKEVNHVTGVTDGIPICTAEDPRGDRSSGVFCEQPPGDRSILALLAPSLQNKFTSDGLYPRSRDWAIRGSLELHPRRKGKEPARAQHGDRRGERSQLGRRCPSPRGLCPTKLCGAVPVAWAVLDGRLDRAVRPARLLPRAAGVLVPAPPQVKHYGLIFVPALARRLGLGRAFTESFFCSTSRDGVMSSRRSGLP